MATDKPTSGNMNTGNMRNSGDMMSGGSIRSTGDMSSGGSTGAAMMDKAQIIDTLNDLLVVDYNAVGLYDKVLQNLDRADLRGEVESFRGDHQRHIEGLRQAVLDLGGNPSEGPSMIGPLAKMFTSITSALMGNKGALTGLLQGEEYTTSSYDKADINGLPEHLRAMVMRNKQDEYRHLQWVKETLKRM